MSLPVWAECKVVFNRVVDNQAAQVMQPACARVVHLDTAMLGPDTGTGASWLECQTGVVWLRATIHS